MSESASYIIVPPDDATSGGFSLQDLIEGLQSGRLILGNDNVVINAQQQEQQQEEDEEPSEQPQQLVFSLPEAEPEPEQPTATVAVDNTQEPAQVNITTVQLPFGRSIVSGVWGFTRFKKLQIHCCLYSCELCVLVFGLVS